MLARKAYDKLLAWKQQPKKKALCILGARQTGKTTLIRQFGRQEYVHFVEVNFITDTGAAQIFAGDLDADTLITNLTAYTRQAMVPGQTLVLLDEIQACPNARKSGRIRWALKRYINYIPWILRNMPGPTGCRRARYNI